MALIEDANNTTVVSKGPQLIDHLPRAEQDALQTFIQLPGNTYQQSALGRSRQKEDCMVCDCQYEYGTDPAYMACGHGSDCINRLTQVECLEEECRCRSHCQNQRFQRRQYADIDIVLTEKKGYGLRAGSDLLPDAFVYEYIGEVVNQSTFLRRMRDYAEEGIKHFYFMMLQREEYIDATKKGGIGRFANHSCNPNCYVAKWVVGPKVRMGIFAKRKIVKGEELTFNYNVDRYGHDAQPCYCGEPNCVGFIGGKTQTDLGGMEDLYLDALGIAEDVEKMSLRGTKKKKSRKLDEDYLPVLRPVDEAEVPKVIAALRQATNKRIVHKLLTRIRITEDDVVQRRLMRMYGFNLMASVLEEFGDDEEVVLLALESMNQWPMQYRNRIEDAQLEDPVKKFAQNGSEKLREVANQLLSRWSALEVAYRIPKRVWKAADDAEQPSPNHEMRPMDATGTSSPPRPLKKIKVEEDIPASITAFQPMGFKFGGTPLFPRSTSSSTPKSSTVASLSAGTLPQPVRSELEAIIAQAAAAATAPAVSITTSSPSKRHHRPQNRPSDGSRGKLNDSAAREKRMSRLVSEVVVQCMSKHLAKHSIKLEREDFKRYAKELTDSIVEKEKRSVSYSTARLDKLSDEKQTKMRKFIKAYLTKLQHRDISRSLATGIQLHDSSGTPEEIQGMQESSHDGELEGAALSLTPDDPPGEDVHYLAESDEEHPDRVRSWPITPG